MDNIIDGKKIAKSILTGVKKEIKKLNFSPHLAIINIGKNTSSYIYYKTIKKISKSIGVKTNYFNFPSSIKKETLKKTIHKLNKNKKINGILLQLPLPKKFNPLEFQKEISPLKDIEGVNPYNLGNLLNGKEELAPCTSLSVLEIIKRYKITLKNKKVAILGHSSIVGKPINLLLLSKYGFNYPDIFLLNISSKNFKKYLKDADIVIIGVGKAKFLKSSYVKKNSIVIDIGINHKNNKITGDADFEKLKDKTALITPVPGGVGAITTAILFKKLLYLTKQQNK